MIEWTLILTLLLQDPTSFSASMRALSIEHVPGFATREACIAAGATWRRDLDRFKAKKGQPESNVRASAVCVASTLPQLERSAAPPPGAR